jgi:uncharacterized protein YodC (DUF2158 family)
MNLKPGDIVRLKSGGPQMTVNFVEGQNVDCVWFGPDGNVKLSSFPAAALAKEE